MECKHEFTMCRLCLCENENFIGIFHVNKWFGYVAAEVITDLFQLTVTETDGYPHVICSMCLGKLTNFKQFKQQCLNSRDTYDNVFMSYNGEAEHPIDVEPSTSIKSDLGEGTNYFYATTGTDLNPEKSEEVETITDDILPQKPTTCIKTELEEETNYVDDTTEADLNPVKPEEEEIITDGIPPQIGKPESDGDAEEEGSDMEGGQETTLGVNERVGNEDHFKCYDCGIEFEIKDALIRHMELHGYVVNGASCREERDSGANVNFRSECGAGDVCRKGFKRITSGEGVSDEGDRRHVCDACDLGFKYMRDMRNHLRVHVLDRPFACDICGRRLKDKSSLRRHKLIHADGKLCICEVCGKSFVYESQLVTHRRIHFQEKPYVCEECGKSFANGSYLRRHGLTHTGEKPFGCEICGKTFSQKGTVTVHMRLHSGEMPFKCEVCDMCFTIRSNLTKHLRIHSQ